MKNEKKKPFFLRWWFILLVVVLITITLKRCGGSETYELITWNDIILGEMLPEPPKKKAEIRTNSAVDFQGDIAGISDKQFADYVEKCKARGFVVDAESTSSAYEAYNAEGYGLRLSHYRSNKEMSISLEAPMEMGDILWPESDAGKQVPAPKSTTGKFSHEYSDNFFVYVGETSKTEYAEYVKICMEKGFNVDYNKGDNYYYADNSKGWHISIRYEGNNVMSIDVDAPKKEEVESADTPASTSTPAPTPAPAPEPTKDSGGMDPEFKAAMDSYETFMNEYVAFMKKYKANPSDLSLLKDYTTYMSKYAAVVSDFEKWNSSDMNVAETAYYLEVQGRVSKKLLEAAQ